VKWFSKEELAHDRMPYSDPRFSSVVVGIIHYTGGKTMASDLRYLRQVDKDPNLSASYNALVGNGQAVELLNPKKFRAWHAGKSSIKHGGGMLTGLNAHSVGVAVSNAGWQDKQSPVHSVQAPMPGTTDLKWWQPYEDEDIVKLCDVCFHYEKELKTVLPWVGHQDVSPLRKFDPGPLFPWGSFHRRMLVLRRGLLPVEDNLVTVIDDLSEVYTTVKDTQVGRMGMELGRKVESALAYSVFMSQVGG